MDREGSRRAEIYNFVSARIEFWGIYYHQVVVACSLDAYGLGYIVQ